ncbi:MAG: Rne/Rng family ribonuclease [Rhodospirillaceae bacterium]|nr:Rne/Rng family ribonuclease [Rhodospirillaceae bacterium]
MTTRMLIDATHPEETRVVVVSGNRLEDFDYESSRKSQLKGNIYLAKVTRVEPSLQAAFVDYGGNRHGFLAFNEIHPDYYRIPIEDREKILRQEAAAAEAEEEEIDTPADAEAEDAGDSEPEPIETLDDASTEDAVGEDAVGEDAAPADDSSGENAGNGTGPDESGGPAAADSAGEPEGEEEKPRRRPGRGSRAARAEKNVDTVGGDEIEDMGERRRRALRRYRIQEVISRRQIILIQVAKEERGNKGAAITSYISLAGRYCVLMPNTPRGGGISRKISNMADRKRLKKILDEFDIPDGMAVIVRTAGARRTKAEIRRDYEYLLKLWDEIRQRTLESTAPALIHEEGNLVKRSIRDLYSKEIDEVLVEGDDGYRTAKDFMKLLIPSHAKRVRAYKEPQIPLFQRYQVEAQIDNIQSPVVQLKSGGSIVLNSTEALVAIDVNSGRATRERNIEETALKTNLEASDEIARQLKLRDLAGLIVIDFIDMEDGRNRHAVERRLKAAMGSDRARIQIGRISAFGLLEMSRQRLRPSVLEVSSNACPTCGGSGLIRSTESTALTVLRAIEEEGTRQRAEEITVAVPPQVAFYILNQKRTELTAIEQRYDFRVLIDADETLIPPEHRIEKTLSRPGAADEEEAEAAEETNGKRRRRRGGRKRRGDDPRSDDGQAETQAGAETAEESGDAGDRAGTEARADDSDEPKRRRRGRRGGRRRRTDEEGANGEDGNAGVETEAADRSDSDAAPEDTDLTADDAAPAPAAAETATPEVEAEAKPRTARRRRTAKRTAARSGEPAPDHTSEQPAGNAAPDADATDGTAGSGPEPADEEAAPAEPPKPAKARRSRARKTAAGAEPEPAKAPEASPEAAEPETGEREAAESGRTNGSGARQGKDAPDASSETAAYPVADSGETDDSPTRKRRGWWNVGR